MRRVIGASEDLSDLLPGLWTMIGGSLAGRLKRPLVPADSCTRLTIGSTRASYCDFTKRHENVATRPER